VTLFILGVTSIEKSITTDIFVKFMFRVF